MGRLRHLAGKLLRRLRPDRPSGGEVLPTAPAPSPAPVADGEQLATIECGAQELRERIEAGETVTLVDVREPHERASGIIPGAVSIPLRELAARWEELQGENEIVCYCAMGSRSYNAAMLLRKNGLINATSLEGGIQAWRGIGGAVAAP